MADQPQSANDNEQKDLEQRVEHVMGPADNVAPPAEASTEQPAPKAAESAPEPPSEVLPIAPAEPTPAGRFKRLMKDRRTWIALGVILLVLLALPSTRYKLLGLALKKSVTITVVDSKTTDPVSSANVNLGGKTAKTGPEGTVRLKAGIGPRKLQVEKHYYKTLNTTYFVGLRSAKSKSLKLTATGRLVPITALDKVTDRPLKGVEIKVLNTAAKTDAKGHATIALPANAATDQATLSLSGYNATAVTVTVTDQIIKANTFKLTPAGHIYFLSNQTGNIDVVKTDLDGADRKVVLAGTGREDSRTISLLAARDWRYVVLKSNREGSQSSLFVIDTSNDKVTQFDSSIGDFSLIGWYGHNFMYSLGRDSLPFWQSGRQLLKSYDADHAQLNQIDQSQAEGTPSSYAYQNFYNFYIVDGAVVYNTQWYTFNADPGNKVDTVRAVQADGRNKKDYQSFPANTIGSVQAVLYEPSAIYYAMYNNNSAKTAYYVYANQAVKVAQIDSGDFSRDYPTFLISPSGKQTFWSELRDGKNVLFTGDSGTQNKQQVAPAGDFAPYGWHSDTYLLLAKNSSELYIMPANGLGPHEQPYKITDYYKPPQVYQGYGYGYGGL
jgi:hypothetical protein